MVCSKDEVLISIPRINESTSPTQGTNPEQNNEAARNTTTAATTSNTNSNIGNESTPLLDHKKDGDHTFYGESPADDEEHITFAYIPMPGLWKEDKPGKNTDRIIILLFVLLASMIVVSIDSCTYDVHIIVCKMNLLFRSCTYIMLFVGNFCSFIQCCAST